MRLWARITQAAAQCEKMGELETADLPDLLLQQSISTHKRATQDMASHPADQFYIEI